MDAIGSHAVNESLFKYVVRLVHQLGGMQQTYSSDLVQFGETMVDSKKRRCTYQLYREACALPVTAPHCKVAIIKKQYSLQPDESKVVPNPHEGWKTVQACWLQQLEVMLRYLKLEGVRAALSADIPPGTDASAIERTLTLRLVETVSYTHLTLPTSDLV